MEIVEAGSLELENTTNIVDVGSIELEGSTETDENSLINSAVQVHNYNPEQQAQNNKKMAGLGMPKSFATPAMGKADLDQMNLQIEEFKKLKGTTAKYISDPEFAKIAKDDIPNLKKTEDDITMLGITAEVMASTISGLIAFPISGVAGASTAVAKAVGLTDIPAKEMQDRVLNLLTIEPKSTTAQESMQILGKAMNVFKLAGQGWAGITEGLSTLDLQSASDVASGKSGGSNFMVPVMGSIGEASAMFGLGESIRLSKEHVTKIVDNAKQSKLRARDPEAHASFINDLSKDGDPVKISTEQINKMFKEAGKTPEDFFDDPTIYYEKQFEGNVKTDLPVSEVSKLADNIRPEDIDHMSIGDVPSKADLDMALEASKAKDATKIPEAKPTEQPPVGDTTPQTGTGAERVRGVSKNIERTALEKELINVEGELGEKPTYNVRSRADKVDELVTLLDKDPERAWRIVDGKESAPEGLYPEEVLTTIRNRAELNGDVETLSRLMNVEGVKVGTELGRRIQALDSRAGENSPFNAMKAVSKVRQEKGAKTGKKPATEKQLIKAEETVKKAKEKLDKKDEVISKEKLTDFIKNHEKEIETRKATRTVDRAKLDSEFQELSRELNKILSPNKLMSGIDPTVIPVLIKMAKNRIEAGIITVEGLVDAIHFEVKDLIGGISKREVRDAISGYGKTTKPNQDPIIAQLRELKAQARLISALEDAEKGQAPLKTGFQRDAISDEVRTLQKQVKEEMRKSGIVTTSPEQQMKSALDAVKTRLKNQITDLNKQLKTGEKTAKKTGIKYDEEANSLKAERDTLKKAIEEIEGKPEMTDEQRIRVATNAVEKSIAEYERRIKAKELTTPKKVSKTPETPELKKLRTQRAELKEELNQMKKDAKPPTDPEKARIKTLEKSIAEYERRIKEQDIKPKEQTKKPETATTQKLVDKRDSLKTVLEQMRKDAKPPKDPEAIQRQTYKTRLTNQIAKIEKQLESGDIAKPEKTERILDTEMQKLKDEYDVSRTDLKNLRDASGIVTRAEITELVNLSKDVQSKKALMEQGGDRMNYGRAKVLYDDYVDALKTGDDSVIALLKDRLDEFKTTAKDNPAKAGFDALGDAIVLTGDTTTSILATLDNSFLGRQGIYTAMTHPSAWYPAAVESFATFVNTLGPQTAWNELRADIVSRPNHLNGKYQKAGILVKTEEQFPTSIPGRIPGLGRVFKASEVAFTGTGLKMRADLFDLLEKNATSKGLKTSDPKLLQDLGKLTGGLTARGTLGRVGENALVRYFFWAGKMLAADFEVLTAHWLGAGLNTWWARGQAAKNLGKIIGETAIIMTVANALSPGSAETEPLSSDFGKIKVNDTRFATPASRMATIVTLADRLATGARKSTSTGLITKYGSEFGEKSRLDAVYDFLENKERPPVAFVTQLLRGVDRDGNKITPGSALYQTATPMSAKNFWELDSEDTADAVAGAIGDLVGVNANTYRDDSPQTRSIISRLRKDKTLTPDQQVEYDRMTIQQKRYVDKQSAMTATQAGFYNLDMENKLYTYSKATQKQRNEIDDIFRKSIISYLDNINIDERDNFLTKVDEADKGKYNKPKENSK